MGTYIDITNNKFGILKALKFSKKIGNTYIWLCQCKCGKKTEVRKGHLMNGHIKSCGCLQIKTLIKRNTTHGISKVDKKFYKAWKAMRERCSNYNTKYYKYYGGSGIKVCDEWNIFSNFFKDMFTSYQIHIKKFGNRQTTIERKDVNGNYSRNNCEWATWKVQRNNRRK